MHNKNTTELLSILNSIDNPNKLDGYINDTLKSVNTLTLHQYLNDLCDAQSISKSELINNADISRTYGYQILNGTKKPSRDNIIKLCISGKFTFEETEKALTLGGVSKLYAKDIRDSILIFCINKNVDVIQANLFLDSKGHIILGDK